MTSERTVELASHEAVVQPDFGGKVVFRTGAVLPDVRADSGSWIGVEIVLGKTYVESIEVLTQRYAAIAGRPEGQVRVVRRAVTAMAVDALARGAALATIPLLVWVAIGRRRRRLILKQLPSRRGAAGAVVVVLVAVGLTTPWRAWESQRQGRAEDWIPLGSYLGPQVELPEEATGIEVLTDATTGQTRRLIESTISTYQLGREFYADAAEEAGELFELREPDEGEVVVLLVSDRHDNIGMDAVARAIGDTAGATAVFDAGDDTSTGEAWEAFSLDSLAATFDDVDERWAVAGNHDHGAFVRSYLEDLGWSYFDGEVVDGPGGAPLLGVDDPRSSGLGNWRDETGLTFDEVRTRLADAACAADEDGERVATLLVHDANLGSEALERGCVDLVLGGHTHVQDGPTAVLGENGETGYTFTVGTTGGAAYAIAIGGKLRRPAGVALVTYADGRPVGIQGVTLQTTGRFDVTPYHLLTY